MRAVCGADRHDLAQILVTHRRRGVGQRRERVENLGAGVPKTVRCARRHECGASALEDGGLAVDPDLGPAVDDENHLLDLEMRVGRCTAARLTPLLEDAEGLRTGRGGGQEPRTYSGPPLL